MKLNLFTLFLALPMTLIAQTPSTLNVINATTSTLNEDILVNINEQSCSVGGILYSTPLDCAFGRALAGAAGTGVPQTIRAGAGVYFTNIGLQVTSTNGVPINFHGAAKSSFDGGTTIRLLHPLAAGTTVISFPPLSMSSYIMWWSNITWTDVTIDANGFADMCWDFEAPRDGFFARLGCRNAVGLRSHWRFGGYSNQVTEPIVGTVPQGSNGVGFQTTVDDIFDIKDGNKGPGANHGNA